MPVIEKGSARGRAASQELRVVSVVKVGPNTFEVTTESDAYGLAPNGFLGLSC
jgi:hypothetical protein